MTEASPNALRAAIRQGQFAKPTSGQCPGYLQANMAILPQAFAEDFATFCAINSQPCPLIEKLDIGNPHPKTCVLNNEQGTAGDVRSDLPKYRIYRNGLLVEEVSNVQAYWQQDLVTFLLGCSFTFERALQEYGIPVRNIDEGKNVSMYKTNRMCTSVGIFQQVPLVVSMRPIRKDLVHLAVQITAQFPQAHGAPIHCGDPSVLGIQDLSKVDFGDAVTVLDDEVPCFWACGVTAIMSAIQAKSDICITHSPGHMFVTDLPEPTLDAKLIQK